MGQKQSIELHYLLGQFMCPLANMKGQTGYIKFLPVAVRKKASIALKQNEAAGMDGSQTLKLHSICSMPDSTAACHLAQTMSQSHVLCR
jgi:hypothetical protein